MRNEITFRKTLFHQEMPNRNGGRKVMSGGERCRGRVVCGFCGKTLMKKEKELHIFVCEKVPQEIFQAPFGGSSVSFGTNCNSSLTNPLLGAPLLK